jgi:Spy/CpxP family protein refolding chaperone
MNRHVKWIWAAALLLSPLAASAQPPKTDPGAAPPAMAPAPPADADDGMWLADLFSTGDALESAFDTPDQAPPALGDDPGPPDGDGPMAFDDEGGGGDGPRHGGRHGHMRGPGGRGMMMRHGMAMRFAALDLTDQQRDKLRDIHEAAARKSVQRRADIQLAHMDLRKLMRAETPSASAVNAQIDKISRLQADGMKAHFDTFLQARAVLTPEQLKKLRAGPAEMRKGEHGGHGGED